ncbi:DUF4363 family protein [Clostridium sediminicola]|uniref:DUF4363 family protein n=1 Tax=Clostridium sediminicola TaxID=3114879 RepID=UPI0031F1F8B4
MKIIKQFLIPSLILILFVLAMNSGQILKRSFNNKDDVNMALDNIENDLKNEQWQQAQDNLQNLNIAWVKVLKRIQFSVEKDEVDKINVNISRIQGAIIARDKTAAIIELSEMKGHWDNLGN